MARKRVVLATEYQMTHAVGRRLISQDLTLSESVTRFPALDQWNRLVMQRPQDWIMQLNWGSASAIDGVWQGHGGGFNPGVMCISRNLIEFPDGWFDINYPVPISYGGVLGQGTNWSGVNGNNTTYLVRNNAQWYGDLTMPVMRSVNWGTSNYLESAIVDELRIFGSAPGWMDPSYYSCGIEANVVGETFRWGRLYISDCNGHGIDAFGTGPGYIDQVSLFDNNLAGLRHRSNSSLGSMVIHQLSGDNNGTYLYMNDMGGAFTIGHIKAETGLSNARGKPFKAQVPVYLKGWNVGDIRLLTSAVTGYIDSLIHFWGTANGSRVRIENIAQWGAVNLVTDLRNGKRYYKAPDNLVLNYRATPITIKYVNPTMTVETDYDPLTEAPFGATERLGVVNTPADYNFAAGTPPLNVFGTGTPPPPPPPAPDEIIVTLSPTAVTGTATSQASATVLDQYGAPMANTGTWSATGPGTISPTGLITPAGTTGTIVVTYTQGAVTGSASLTVSAAAPSQPNIINVSLSATNVTAPTAVQATAVVLDQFGNQMPLAGTWSIVSGPATINSGTGLITPTGAAGTAVVRYAQGSAQGTASLTIQAAAPPPPPPQTPLYSISFAGKNVMALPGCAPVPANEAWRAGRISGATYTTHFEPAQTSINTRQVLGVPVAGVKRVVLKQAVIKEAVQYRFVNNDIRVNGNRQFTMASSGATVLASFVPNAPKADITIIFPTPQIMETLFGALSANNTLWLECEGLEFWAQ